MQSDEELSGAVDNVNEEFGIDQQVLAEPRSLQSEMAGQSSLQSEMTEQSSLQSEMTEQSSLQSDMRRISISSFSAQSPTANSTLLYSAR